MRKREKEREERRKREIVRVCMNEHIASPFGFQGARLHSPLDSHALLTHPLALLVGQRHCAAQPVPPQAYLERPSDCQAPFCSPCDAVQSVVAGSGGGHVHVHVYARMCVCRYNQVWPHRPRLCSQPQQQQQPQSLQPLLPLWSGRPLIPVC